MDGYHRCPGCGEWTDGTEENGVYSELCELCQEELCRNDGESQPQ